MKRSMRVSGVCVAGLLALGGAAAAGEAQKEATRPLPASAEEVRPMLVGAPVPGANLLDAAGEPVDLQVRMAQRPTILVFYRGGW